jgi:AICAR transformylase/IMP cyclohydrolase PurH
LLVLCPDEFADWQGVDAVLAILGVSDKRDIGRLAGGLLELGWQVVATEGTRQAIGAAGHIVGHIAELAGVPTLLGGRVKALTVSVLAGILATDSESDQAELRQYGITRVDLVCCNFTPLSGSGTSAGFPENVDIGGVTMLRSAAKNYAHVIPLTDPDDYPAVLSTLRHGDGTIESVPVKLRAGLAAKVFTVSSRYDTTVRAQFDTLTAGH